MHIIMVTLDVSQYRTKPVTAGAATWPAITDQNRFDKIYAISQSPSSATQCIRNEFAPTACFGRNPFTIT